jgi:AcrR family transcriptional regulator
MRVKTDKRRQEILQAAGEVFRTEGYADASMSKISLRLGGSKATLYGYFSSKEELFVAVMHEMSRRHAVPQADELERDIDSEKGLARLVQNVMRALSSRETLDFRRMLIAEAGRTNVGKIAYEHGTKHFLQRISDRYAENMKEGRMREADPWQAAMHLFSLCVGPPVQLVLEGVIDPLSDDELAAASRSAAAVFLRAYALPAAQERTGRKTSQRRRAKTAVGEL